MKTKPVTPYARLLDKFNKFVSSVKYAHRKTMWVFPKAKLREVWTLVDLWQRVIAADQLGYDVRLIANDEGLIVQYIKRPDYPIGW